MATRSISPGQVVLMEQPVIFISNHEEKAADRREEEVLEQYNTLKRKLKKQMNKLNIRTELKPHGKRSARDTHVVNIWYSNCVGVEEKGLYLQFANINHSCSPNCVVNYDEDRNVKIVAFAKILKGEEILINYLNLVVRERSETLLRFERQNKLKAWKFTCKCPVCLLSGQEFAKNESLKKHLACLDERQKQCEKIRPKNTENVVNYARKRLTLEIEICDIMKKLGAETIVYIPDSLHLCYVFSKMLQILGVSLAYTPDHYRSASHQQATMLGDTFARNFKIRDRLADRTLSIVLRDKINAKKASMLNGITIIIQSSPSDVDFEEEQK